MANLVENAEWVDGIYQLETTDLVEGGPDGVDNIQAIQLAKRTQFLKALIIAAQNSLASHEGAADPHPQYLTTAEGNSIIATAVSALVNSSPATLDTLNELAAALGNDPNFATSMATALGLKAPISSPTFTGNPSAPTPASLDCDTSIATTEFVKKSGLSFASATYITSLPSILTSAHAGHFVNVSVGSAGQVFLPLSSSVQNGAAITIFNASSYSLTVTRYSNPDIIVIGNGNSANSYEMEAGTFAVFTCDNGGWVMGARTSQLGKTAAFNASFSSNGYQKLPSGLIIQWGTILNVPPSGVTVTLPIAFPSAFYSVVPTHQVMAGGGAFSITAYQNGSLSTFVSNSNNSVNPQACWIALGK